MDNNNQEERRALQRSVTQGIIKAKKNPNFSRKVAKDQTNEIRANTRHGKRQNRAQAAEYASGNRYKG